MVYSYYFVHIILFVVVFLPIVPIVVLFMFLLTILIVLKAGPLVLLYHESTHYPVHGGGSSNGIVCGTFLYLISHSESLRYWDNGAALF